MSSHTCQDQHMARSKPRISVIVPVYNVEDYIGPMIDSLCRQTFRDFEVVLVDDGSIDDSIRVACRLLELHHIAFRTLSQENAGQAAARNAGLLDAQGDKVVFVDPDDVVHHDFLKLLIAPVDCESARPIFARYQSVTPDECEQFPAHEAKVERLESATARERFLTRDLPIIAPGILCSRAFLLEKKLFFRTDMRFSEDQEWIWRLLFAANSVAIVNAVTYNYVRRPRSIMTSSTAAAIASGFRGFQELAKSEPFRSGEVVPCGQAILARWVIGAAHTSALILDEGEFATLLHAIEYRQYARKVVAGGDIRLNLISHFAWLPSSALYRLYRRFR